MRYLHETVAPRLRQLRDDAASREYLHEAAVLCELIGWMSYDVGQQAAAQRYFAQAVRLAQAAGDEGYAAFAVTSMADQALFVGHPREALRLATVASHRTARGLPIVSLLEARIFEARAQAALGQLPETASALDAATRLFEQMRLDDVPSWGQHWSRGVLLSHTATAWLDLGEARRAEVALDELGLQNEEQPRRRLYFGVQRSRLGLLQHDVEAAARHADQAVAALPMVSSHRSWRQVETQIETLSAAAGRHQQIAKLRECWKQVRDG